MLSTLTDYEAVTQWGHPILWAAFLALGLTSSAFQNRPRGDFPRHASVVSLL